MLIRYLFQLREAFFEISLQVCQVLKEVFLLHLEMTPRYPVFREIPCGAVSKSKSSVFARVPKIVRLLTKARLEVCSVNTHLPRPCNEIFSFSKSTVKTARRAMNSSAEKKLHFYFPGCAGNLLLHP